MAATAGEPPAQAAPTIAERELSIAPKLGNPAPLAVSGFATSSFILGLYYTHLIGMGSLPLFFPVAFFFGGMIQVLVAILEVWNGNVFGAAVFGTYGSFWIILAAINVWFAKMVKPASAVDPGLALFLACIAVVSFYLFLATLKTDVVLAVVFALIVIALALYVIAFDNPTSTGLFKAAGWCTVVFAVLAWYHAAADIINFTFGRSVVPLGKL